MEVTSQSEIKELKVKIQKLTDDLNTAKGAQVVEFRNQLFQDEKMFKFYTGCSWEEFHAIKSFLGPAFDNLKLWTGSSSARTWRPKVLPEDQFILFLVHVRQGLSLSLIHI